MSRADIRTMEEGLWRFLLADTAVQDLDLHVFRTYDGNRIPFNTDKGRWVAELLPAIALELRVIDKKITKRGDSALTRMGFIRIAVFDGKLVYPSGGNGASRDRFEHALITIDDRMNGDAALDVPMLGNAGVSEFLFEFENIQAVSARSAPGEVAYWEADIKAELYTALRSTPR